MSKLSELYFNAKANFWDRVLGASERFIKISFLHAIMQRNIHTYKAKEGDVFLATYPKSGTTWLQNILVQIHSQGEAEFDFIYQASPYLEDSHRPLDTIVGPRFIKTHLAYPDLPKNPPKIIYLARHGLDVAKSYYHHHRKLLGYRGDFPSFYKLFTQGKVNFGSWSQHVGEYIDNPKGYDILHLNFEDLKDDLEAAIHKICDFTGLTLKPEALPKVLHKCSFEYMKAHPTKFDLTYIQARKYGVLIGDHIRKGVSGEWQDDLSENDLNAYRNLFDQYLANKGLDRYRP